MECLDLSRFEQVWVVDAEYRQPPGERPDVHCLVAQELWTGSTRRLWYDELARLRHSPYPVGPGSLFVCYNAIAELSCHLALGWELPCRIVDLLVEFRQLTNGTDWREGQKSKHRLIHAVEYCGMNPMDAVEKSEMQVLAIRGKPFSLQERRDLLRYCERDVITTAELLRRIAPRLTLAALQRGRFTRTAARMIHAGIPLDAAIYGHLQEHREVIIQTVVDEVNPTFDVYQGAEFKLERMEALVRRQNLPWPQLDSGCLDMDKRVWERMADRYPIIRPLYRARRMMSLLRDNDLAIGRDGRNRYGFFPFAAETGRNAWKAAEFIFAQPAYLRGLIQPPPSKALAYLDYGQQEFAVAAVLSGDERMMEAYRADDPYLAFDVQAGLVPRDATKESHGAERKKLKACVLGLQYLISEWGLAEQLNIQTDYAKALILAHQRVYRRFWLWTESVVDRAILDGFQETLLGWRIVIRDGEVMHKGKLTHLFNPRAAVNYPVQGGSADVTRLACNLASERGIALLANVHDALLVEGDVDDIEDLANEVEALMVTAGQDLLDGFILKVDRQIARHPQRLLDSEGTQKQWAWLLDHLDRSAADNMLQTSNIRCCTPATGVSVSATPAQSI